MKKFFAIFLAVLMCAATATTAFADADFDIGTAVFTQDVFIDIVDNASGEAWSPVERDCVFKRVDLLGDSSVSFVVEPMEARIIDCWYEAGNLNAVLSFSGSNREFVLTDDTLVFLNGKPARVNGGVAGIYQIQATAVNYQEFDESWGDSYGSFTQDVCIDVVDTASGERWDPIEKGSVFNHVDFELNDISYKVLPVDMEVSQGCYEQGELRLTVTMVPSERNFIYSHWCNFYINGRIATLEKAGDEIYTISIQCFPARVMPLLKLVCMLINLMQHAKMGQP